MKKILIITILLFPINILNAAFVSNPKGNVFYRTSSSNWTKMNPNDKVTINEGYEVMTERASSVEITFNDGSKLKLGPNSYYRMERETSTETTSNLLIGKARNWIKKHSKEYKIKTPHAICGVRGTDFLVDVDQGLSRIEVYEGSVNVSDNKGRSFLLNKGNLIDVTPQGIGYPTPSKNPPPNLDSSQPDKRMRALKEIYNEVSKEEVIKRAQMEIQSAEYQSRKTAIDAYGYRVRMEEYIIRPDSNQFKYVVLNTRQDRFDFGKILFTFNTTLPDDLSKVTSNMTEYYGSSAPQIYLTEMNSIISNTQDKVTEEASGGKMIPDNPLNPTKWTHFFSNYSFYAAGKNEANENGGKGRLLWSFNDLNNDGKYQTNEYTFLGGEKPTSYLSYPYGEDVLYSISRNDYSDGTWISVADFVVFDNGKVASINDFKLSPEETKSDFIDKLNFERVYTSSIFSDKIDLIFSAKLLKDVGMINLK